MEYEVKKFVLPGMAGVLLACAIFFASIAVPSSKPAMVYYIPDWERFRNLPVNIHLNASDFTESLIEGSEAELTVTIKSKNGLTNAIVEIVLVEAWPTRYSKGVTFNDGRLRWSWSGNIVANVSVDFNLGVVATEVGYSTVYALISWHDLSGNSYCIEDALWVLVLEDEIIVSQGFIIPPDSNVTSPNPTDLPDSPIPPP